MNLRQKLEQVEIALAEINAYLDSKETTKIINLEVMKERELAKGVIMRKLKYGQGTIIKRSRKNKNGSFYMWYQGRWYDGERQHTVTAKTADKCIEKLKQQQNEFKKSSKKKQNLKNIMLGEWLDIYYKTYKEPFIADSTKSSYMACLKLHISKELKQLPLNKLNSLIIQDNINRLELPRQRQITAQLLKSALKQAFDNGLINNIIDIKIPKHKTRQKNILSKADEVLLLNELPEFMKNAVIGYLNTGCRLKELLNICETDIDRENKTIQIKGTKTADAVRVIPLLPIVEDILPLKIDVTPTYMQRVFKRAVQKLGLNITIHDLRHTFATRCLEVGVNMKTIQKWLGHSNYSVTADTYSHITANFEQSEVDKLVH